MEKLLELFTTQPGFKILDVTAHADALTQQLSNALVPAQGRLALAHYPGEHHEPAVDDTVQFQAQSVPDYAKPFRALPRDNDIVFIRDVLHRHKAPERVLRAVYTTLANAAIVVIVTAEGEVDPQMQLAMLEKADFRAGNVIEGIAEGFTVVTGKKMHMWGNGL